MKLKVWLDSGANAFSCYTQIIDTEEFGLTDEEWNSLSDDEKYEDYIKEVAFNHADWGFEVIE